MAKKNNIRQQREAEAQAKKAKYAKAAEEREQAKKAAEAEASKSEKVSTAAAGSEKLRENDKKSFAKAAGVKSVFAVGNTVYMTSFGKGNNAVLEKKILNTSGEDINTEAPAYTLTDIGEKKYGVESGRIKGLSAVSDSPLAHDGTSGSVPTDMLCLKDKLETKYYGRTFDDNIHIQLIYNILDVEKILAQYSANAVYALNNLSRNTENEGGDFIGSISSKYPYAKLSEKNKELLSAFAKNQRLGYFGSAFYKNDGRKRTDKEIYDIIALVGSLRQWSFHGNEKNDGAWLYKLESLDKEFLDILDSLYSEAAKRVNSDFAETNKVNIQILASIYNNEAFNDIVKEYYDFLVTKKYKNIGFSIKKLRELMVADTEIKDEKYDSVRSKLYKLIDFVIYHGYLNEGAAMAEKLVDMLRGTIPAAGKEQIYVDEAARLWEKYGDTVINDIAPSVDGKNIRQLNKETLPSSDISGILVGRGKVSYFTKLMYLLTLFIDGKEINDLLTTLINKFDNIRSFNDTMKELGLETAFTEEYAFWNDSEKLFAELTELNSFARMCPIDLSAKKIMYRDAIDILGIETSLSEEELSKLIDKMLCLDADGKPIKGKGKDSGLRNFIASNVIDSVRFRYLIRYGNSKKIRETAKCGSAVKFVLEGIPDTQIDRYYESCRDIKDKPAYSYKEKRAYLAEQIGIMSFERFEGAGKVQKANVDRGGQDAETKRRFKALIRLYLTVMYLMLKNLVNVNARYVIAFHCLERDAQLYGTEIKKDYSALTASLMGITDADRNPAGEIICEMSDEIVSAAGNKHLRKKRWYGLVLDNLKNSEKKVVTEFRNTVAHLNAVRNIDENIKGIAYVNNYFELYHYIIQRHLKASGAGANETAKKYYGDLESYHTYSKDFVKAYCVPAAYNLVRYKNLTIDGQFDKNFIPEKGDDGKTRKKS